MIRVLGLAASALIGLALLTGTIRAEEGKRPNVLIFVIDDLNDYVGCLGGHPNASTPNIDGLAKRGVLFTNAHCNAPVCKPSRTSVWTGLRPTTTGIISNRSGWFRKVSDYRDTISLPQAMAREGYETCAFGKVCHRDRPDHAMGEWQRYNSFNYGPRLKPKMNYQLGDAITDWGVPSTVANQPASYDPQIAQRTINALEDCHERPWLLGCGFYRPHTPLYADQKWFDLHPRDQIQLPKTIPDDTADLVYFGKRPRREQDVEAPGLFTQDWVEENDKWKDLLQAYLACSSAMDYELGRVLDALAKSPYADNTYVILFSDHGWHLGEKRHWGKAALWDQTTRIPMIIAGPGIPQGKRCDRPVDLLCIYPTVMDLVGLELPCKVEGHSLRPLLKDPDAEWPHPVLITFVDHHALRTDRWRYIRYASGEEELYDDQNDPDEFTNLAGASASGEIGKTLNQLRAEMNRILQQPGP